MWRTMQFVKMKTRVSQMKTRHHSTVSLLQVIAKCTVDADFGIFHNIVYSVTNTDEKSVHCFYLFWPFFSCVGNFNTHHVLLARYTYQYVYTGIHKFSELHHTVFFLWDFNKAKKGDSDAFEVLIKCVYKAVDNTCSRSRARMKGPPTTTKPVKQRRKRPTDPEWRPDISTGCNWSIRECTC